MDETLRVPMRENGATTLVVPPALRDILRPLPPFSSFPAEPLSEKKALTLAETRDTDRVAEADRIVPSPAAMEGVTEEGTKSFSQNHQVEPTQRCAKRTGPNGHGEKKSMAAASNDKTPTKRQRFADNCQDPRIRNEVAEAARSLRNHGVEPKILFFPSLTAELKKDAQLRNAIGVELDDFKALQLKGKKMAWATFKSEQECLGTLASLRTMHPLLKVSLHRPKREEKGQSSRQRNAESVFDKKVQEVVARGGLGNTLMLRNLPVEVDSNEIEQILSLMTEGSDPPAAPLRVRSALSKGRASQNFWLVYSGVGACRIAFSEALLKTVSFRCGKTTKLHPMIHDDSTDADERKRRERATALGEHPSTTRGRKSRKLMAEKDSVELLEDFLLSRPRRLLFLSNAESESTNIRETWG